MARRVGRIAATGIVVVAAVGIGAGLGVARGEASAAGRLTFSWSDTLGTVAPGQWVSIGYGVSMPEAHPAAAVDVSGIAVSLPYACGEGSAGGTWTVTAPPVHVDIASGSTGWTPAAAVADPANWQAAARLPALCGTGSDVTFSGEQHDARTATSSAVAAATLAASLTSADQTDPVALRVHVVAAWASKSSVDCADPAANPSPGLRSCSAQWIDAGATTAAAPPPTVTPTPSSTAVTQTGGTQTMPPPQASAAAATATPVTSSAPQPAPISQLSVHALTSGPRVLPAAGAAASRPAAHGGVAAAATAAPSAGTSASTAPAADSAPATASPDDAPAASSAPAAAAPAGLSSQLPATLSSRGALGFSIWHWLAIAAGLNAVFLVVTVARRARAFQPDV